MAEPSSWIPHVEAFVDSSRPSTQQDASLDAVASLLKNDLLTIEALVREMEMYLTTSDSIIRGRGILLLAEVLKRLVSMPLDNATIHSLIGFFTSRLADWQALRGALIGCLALLRRKPNVGMVLGSDASDLAKSYLSNLQVQSLALHDRKLCLELLECLMDRYPHAVAALGDDLVYAICEAIDEEKDPRCLMLTFRIVEMVVRLFPNPSGPVANFAGELFDILGRYFPIYFTHLNKGDCDIKRDDLSRALMLAFSSTPFFEPLAIPLLLDKLNSSLPLAKLDSLKYLSTCALHYGPDRMKKHASSIWSSLKDAIRAFAPKEPLLSLTSTSAEDTGSQENEIAKEAVQCLKRIIVQFESSKDFSFVAFIVEDEDVERIFTSISGNRSYKDIPADSKKELYSLGSILSVSAKVSSSCCNIVFRSFFLRLMDVMGISTGGPSLECISNDNIVLSGEKLNFGALYLCIELLAACRDLALGSKESHSQSTLVQETWYSFLQNFSGPLAGAFASTLASADNLEIEEADICFGVKGLQILATFPGILLAVSKETYESILKIFVSFISTSHEKRSLWKLVLNALVEIGSFIEKYHDHEKEISYMSTVVEKIMLLLPFEDSDLPLSLKMEAISSIGTAALNFMSTIVQGLEEAISANFLEATVEGNLKSAETLISILECYSSHVIPWFQRNGGLEEVALRFAVNIWDQIEKTMTFNISIQGQGFLDATMTAMRLAVGSCMQENQGLIIQKAFNILSSSTSFFANELVHSVMSSKLEGLLCTQDLVSLSCRDEWLISLFASVVVALHPQTLPEVRVILRFFVIVILLRGHVPVAQALGSMINKWLVNINIMEVSNICNLEEALHIISQMGLGGFLENDPLRKFSDIHLSHESLTNLSPIVGNSSLVQIHVITGLAWVGKGLLMRGHEKVKGITLLLLKCLLSSGDKKIISSMEDAVRNGSQDDTQALVARTAADAFDILLSDSEVCLNQKFHATIRPLYKQHFFSSVMPLLLSSIKEHDSPATRTVLYRAVGHLISNAPLVAIVNEAKKLIPLLLDGLSMLSLDILNKDLTYSLLLVLCGILMHDNGQEAVTEHTHAIITHLIRLISYPHAMLVRETAIQCLVAMSALPYVKIYPMRSQVLKSISKSIDDPKRNVRQEAVRCRHAWASLTS